MKKIAAFTLTLLITPAFADVIVPMRLVNEKGVGASVGQVTISESKYHLLMFFED